MKRLICIVAVVGLVAVAGVLATAEENEFVFTLNLGVDLGYNKLAFDIAGLGWSTPEGDPVVWFKAGIWRLAITATPFFIDLIAEEPTNWVIDLEFGRLVPHVTLGLEFYRTGSPEPFQLLVEGGVFLMLENFFLRTGLSWPGGFFIGFGIVF